MLLMNCYIRNKFCLNQLFSLSFCLTPSCLREWTDGDRDARGGGRRGEGRRGDCVCVGGGGGRGSDGGGEGGGLTA